MYTENNLIFKDKDKITLCGFTDYPDEVFKLPDYCVVFAPSNNETYKPFLNNIKKFIAGKNFKTVERDAFYCCKNLKELDFSKAENVWFKTNAFYSCIGLEELNLKNVSRIGCGAFAFCSSLKKIYLPDAINVFQDAFDGCNNLSDVYLSKKLMRIEDLSSENLDFLVHYAGSKEDFFKAECAKNLYDIGKINIEFEAELTLENLLDSGLTFRGANDKLKEIKTNTVERD